MKRTILSVSVAVALTVSPQSFAADTGIDHSDSFFNESMQFGGHVGMSYEYEDKVTKNFKKYGGAKITEKTKNFEVLSLYYSNPVWDFAAYYGLKLHERTKTDVATTGKVTWKEEEEGYKHLLSLDKGFKLSNGWDSGLIYDLEYTDGDYDTLSGDKGLSQRMAEHSVRPYLTYWNNEYGAGFYSNLEYLFSDETKNGYKTEEKGYSLLFKPYKRFGNWELGVEFFYQIKDTKGFASNGSLDNKTDFTEMYFEPIVQYSFEDAGTIYTRIRIGENETKDKFGYGEGATYLKDIRKATIGYEQAVGDNWLLKAEYERAEEDETVSNFADLAGDKKTIEQDTFFVQALYRF
ncbi:porin [Vibrio sp. HN007]|uniref:porin n=1 Tax=Vibrio iocasae TaxID=3098914 RepID=UPI0035D4558A